MSKPNTNGDWHLSPARLDAYANGPVGPADAWSAEAHLVCCPMCRAELAIALTPADRELITSFRAGLTRRLPARTSVARRQRISPQWQLVLRPGALVAVGVALLAAVLLDVAWRSSLGGGRGVADAGLLWLLAPVLPLAGIALCSVGEHDPWREVVLAAPSSGLRLTLWRTVLVLVVSLPAAVVVGLLLDGDRPVLWLLPCLALTAASLALGTVIVLEWATAWVALIWATVALGQILWSTGGAIGIGFSLDQMLVGDQTLFEPAVQPIWAAIAVAAAAVLFLRRDTYQQLPTAAGKRIQ